MSIPGPASNFPSHADAPGERRLGRVRGDGAFLAALGVIGGAYALFILLMVGADIAFTSPGHLLSALRSREIRFSIWLSVVSCTLTAILSLWVSVPMGYLLSRHGLGRGGRGWRWVQRVVDAILDIPIVLPPLVIGLSLLILFQTPLGRGIERYVSVTYAVPSVILAQFSVACAFAVRTMKVTFDQIPPRSEQVALTLGCTRAQAFWRVVLPQAWRGTLAAGTLAWARALGEFGPILVFSGATRLRTEVLSTTVFLELSVGKLEAAVAVSLLMILVAVLVLILVRVAGADQTLRRGVA